MRISWETKKNSMTHKKIQIKSDKCINNLIYYGNPHNKIGKAINGGDAKRHLHVCLCLIYASLCVLCAVCCVHACFH